MEPDVTGQTPAEVQNQPATQTPTGSEAASTQDRGDVQEALRQAREEARQAKAALNDPNAVFEAAKRLGMANDPESNESAPPPAPAPAPQPEQPAARQSVTKREPTMEERMFDALEYRDALKLHPELFSDQDTLGYIQSNRARGLSWTESASKVAGLSTAPREQADLNTARTQATSAAPSANITSQSAQETLNLQAQLHQGSPNQRKEALLEILRRENSGMR